MATVQLAGLDDLQAALLDLSKTTAKNVLLQTAIEALTPMAELAAELAPDDPHTGAPDLKTSIQVGTKRSGKAIELTESGPATVRVYMGPTKDGYPEAMVQEFGAKPHDEFPKVKPELVFKLGQTLHGATVVHHPGNRPHPYMRPAYERLKESTLTSVAGILGGRIKAAADRAERKAARLAAKAQGS